MAARISPAQLRALGIDVPKAKRGKGKTGGSSFPLVFLHACVSHGLPVPVSEHRFHKVRRWRFDWAWPAVKVALEIDGGAWIEGHHTRGQGFIDDQEKSNEAVILGWRIVRCVPEDVETGKVFDVLRRLFKEIEPC